MDPSQQSFEFNTAFSTVDMTACVVLPAELGHGNMVRLGTLQMLSVSMHRDKFPVSACSRVGPRGFTSGHRTIGGSLAFASFDKEAFSNIGTAIKNLTYKPDYLHADELFPFDIMIVTVDDYGRGIHSTLQGVTILDTGVSYGLDSIVMSEQYSYMAVNRTPWTSVGDVGPTIGENQYTQQTSEAFVPIGASSDMWTTQPEITKTNDILSAIKVPSIRLGSPTAAMNDLGDLTDPFNQNRLLVGD